MLRQVREGVPSPVEQTYWEALRVTGAMKGVPSSCRTMLSGLPPFTQPSDVSKLQPYKRRVKTSEMHRVLDT
jgi:hypothetical protein